MRPLLFPGLRLQQPLLKATQERIGAILGQRANDMQVI